MPLEDLFCFPSRLDPVLDVSTAQLQRFAIYLKDCRDFAGCLGCGLSVGVSALNLVVLAIEAVLAEE